MPMQVVCDNAEEVGVKCHIKKLRFYSVTIRHEGAF